MSVSSRCRGICSAIIYGLKAMARFSLLCFSLLVLSMFLSNAEIISICWRVAITGLECRNVALIALLLLVIELAFAWWNVARGRLAGAGLLRVARRLYGNDTFKNVFEPIISDLQIETNKAVEKRSFIGALWFLIGYRAVFWVAVIIHVAFQVGKGVARLTISRG